MMQLNFYIHFRKNGQSNRINWFNEEKTNEWKFKQKFKFLFNSEKEWIVIIRNFWNDERDWMFERNFLRKDLLDLF